MSCAETAESIEMSSMDMDLGGSKYSHIRQGAHWRQLANTSEPSMCGGDAAFLSNYFDHLLNSVAPAVKYILCCVPNRTGKRTILGLLSDGWNSAYRYFLNNFYDGFRQVIQMCSCFRQH